MSPERAPAKMDRDGGDTPAAGGIRSGEDLVAVRWCVSVGLSSGDVEHIHRHFAISNLEGGRCRGRNITTELWRELKAALSVLTQPASHAVDVKANACSHARFPSVREEVPEDICDKFARLPAGACDGHDVEGAHRHRV